MGIHKELVTVHHGDARDVLIDFADNSFDVLICDPPYGIGISKNETTRPHWDGSDNAAFDPDFWRECGRVLKPGATLAAFGHSRTVHRLTTAIENSFSIVDTIAWLHGQGFPAGNRRLDTELHRLGAHDLADSFEGWGTMLRPAYEPIVIARNLSKRGSLSESISAGGAGGFHLDAVRVPTADARQRTHGQVSPTATWQVNRPASSRSTPHAGGRHPANVILEHSEACHDDACAPQCAVATVRAQGEVVRKRGEDASRFYGVLHHPKATSAERPVDGVIAGNAVKPLTVMDWLVKLLARPGELVLDPFAGTGTTLEACARAGVRSVGIERESEYVALIKQRLARVL
ncbi:DNA-methyltransferase [Cryobacterium lyxosi]|uniref:Methyltransferase n=1 Tax=Cryobacterium lyxosi TaxID=1259228 RepID=A0A4R8ZI81_9MICO|nr:site-specific DNA-methyltransferase [Cryobacterium lyxosi]TFD26629.1 site-specific DNA-methyltransferase [Cryobacterium lyxosi]